MGTRGRPKSEEPRNVVYHLRMTKKEYDVFNSISKLFGKTKSEVFREALKTYYEYHEKHGM